APGGERQSHPQGRDERGDPRLGDERREHLLRHRQRRRSAPLSEPGARSAASHRRRGARAVDRAPRRAARRRGRLRRRRLQRHGRLHRLPGRPRGAAGGGRGRGRGARHRQAWRLAHRGQVRGPSRQRQLRAPDRRRSGGRGALGERGARLPRGGARARPPPGHRPARRPDRDRRGGPACVPGNLSPRGHPPGAGDGPRARPGAGRRARARTREAAAREPLRPGRQGSRPRARGDRAARSGVTDMTGDVAPGRRLAGPALALALVVGCASTPSAPPRNEAPDAGAASIAPGPPPGLRLPTEVRPTGERLSLRLDPRATTFTGTARIQLTVDAPVSGFWLHAQDLTIRRASLIQNGAEQPVRTVVTPPDLLQVVPGTRLAPGQAELVLEYEGPLDRERSRGIYRVDEQDGPYLYTFFEPVDARRAFPSFDEPSFKIPWELEISVPPGSGAFANTAEAGRQTGADGWVTVRFERSRPLPTYLVAFAAGPFDV